jgi:hypothetical protein
MLRNRAVRVGVKLMEIKIGISLYDMLSGSSVIHKTTFDYHSGFRPDVKRFKGKKN